MARYLAVLLILLPLLSGCSPQGTPTTREINSFIEVLQANGVKGALEIGKPLNDDMDYVATYVISAYTSTRILSFFKCRDSEKAERNLAEALKNPKLSGQARNGSMLMVATFYPPDDEAVAGIKALFMAHRFE